MFTLCSAKDTLFTSALLMLMLALLDLGSDREVFCILEKDGFLCSKRPGDDAVS